MNQNNALLKGIENLATLVSTMVATSRIGIELVAEQPAIERKGMKSINYKLAAGLVAAGLGCGTNIHNYYGPNGEEITSSGNCGEFNGQYLWVMDCDAGSSEPVSEDCVIKLGGNGGHSTQISIDGRNITFVHNSDGLIHGRLLKRDEITLADLSSQYGHDLGSAPQRFLCQMEQNPDLWALSGNGRINPSIDSLALFLDKPFNKAECERDYYTNAPWYKACRNR